MLIKIGFGGYIGNQLFTLEMPVNTAKEYYRRLIGLLKISPVKNKLCRLGRHGDGGYVMAEVFRHGSIAYSFGINDDVSWDEDMVQRGYDVYMYDHTIEGLPYKRRGFHFCKCGISSRESVSPPMNTLEHLLQGNNHMNEHNMVLKMDVEGAEWDVLANMEENILVKFSQIVIEYHNLLAAGKKESEIIFAALQKINATHKLIHLHGNNMGRYIKCGDRLFPDALEATYILKGLPSIILSDSEVKLPISLDEPNDPNRADLILGSWNCN